VAKLIPEQDRTRIEEIVRRHPDGVTLQEIANELKTDLPRRTLQYRLKYLVENKRLVTEGKRRWVKYHIPADQRIEVPTGTLELEPQPTISLPLSVLPSKSRNTSSNLCRPANSSATTVNF